MGSALAERLLKARFAVVGFDVRPARDRALRKLGGQSVDSAAAVAAACSRIIFSLPTTGVVESVVREMGNELRAGSVILDTTTGEPDRTAALAARLAARKVRYLDATLVGSSAEARANGVTVLAGGSRRTFTACGDLFGCFARRTFHVGASGNGARLKLVVNLVLGLNRAVLAEGLAFARAIGVSPARALEILAAGAAYSRVMDTKGSKMLKRNFAPQARLSQHLKDVRLILSLGRRRQAKLPLSALHRRLLARLETEGFGEQDNSAIIRAFD